MYVRFPELNYKRYIDESTYDRYINFVHSMEFISKSCFIINMVLTHCITSLSVGGDALVAVLS